MSSTSDPDSHDEYLYLAAVYAVYDSIPLPDGTDRAVSRQFTPQRFPLFLWLFCKFSGSANYQGAYAAIGDVSQHFPGCSRKQDSIGHRPE